jgi:hypothetical protein
VNSGTKESGYGYWFPGPNNDGATGGGFMPEPLGPRLDRQDDDARRVVLQRREDVGYCAAIRTHATILARDPIFGDIAYGGVATRKGQAFEVIPRDGLRVRFHVMRGDQRLHLELDHDGYAKEQPIVVADDLSRIQFTLENRTGGAHTTGLSIAGLPAGRVRGDGRWQARDDDRRGTTRARCAAGRRGRQPHASRSTSRPDLQVGRARISNQLRYKPSRRSARCVQFMPTARPCACPRRLSAHERDEDDGRHCDGGPAGRCRMRRPRRVTKSDGSVRPLR